MDLRSAEILALSLMEQHGLFAGNWNFRFDQGKKRFGLCDFTNRLIQLSAPLVDCNDEKAVRNTILHEIAHALVGPRNGHNAIWKAKAISIGCDGERCHNDNLPLELFKYIACCKSCGLLYPRDRQPNRRLACGRCCKKYGTGFSTKFEFVWKINRGQYQYGRTRWELPADTLRVFLTGSPQITSGEAIAWCLARYNLPVGLVVGTAQERTGEIGTQWAHLKKARAITVFPSGGISYESDLEHIANEFARKSDEEMMRQTDLVFSIWNGTEEKTRRRVEQALSLKRPTVVFNLLKRKISNFNIDENALLKQVRW